MSAPRKRVGVLISGRGSNMEALIRAAEAPDYPAEIALVLSDIAGAPGLQAAQTAGVAAEAIPRAAYASRAAHEDALQAALQAANVEIVCLAGYMRLISPDMAARWAGRMINIHPSLLPSFRGLDTHRRALEAGVRLHGCTVHQVTADLDAGPIIGQTAVPVELDDDEQTLAARVLTAEHALYPACLAAVARAAAVSQSNSDA